MPDGGKASPLSGRMVPEGIASGCSTGGPRKIRAWPRGAGFRQATGAAISVAGRGGNVRLGRARMGPHIHLGRQRNVEQPGEIKPRPPAGPAALARAGLKRHRGGGNSGGWRFGQERDPSCRPRDGSEDVCGSVLQLACHPRRIGLGAAAFQRTQAQRAPRPLRSARRLARVSACASVSACHAD